MTPVIQTVLDALRKTSTASTVEWAAMLQEVEQAGSLTGLSDAAMKVLVDAKQNVLRANPYHDNGGRFSSGGGGGMGGSGGMNDTNGGGGGMGGGTRGMNDTNIGPSAADLRPRGGSFRPGGANGGAKTPRQSYDRSKLTSKQQENYDFFRKRGEPHDSAMQMAKKP